MILKRVLCTVNDQMKARFSTAQEQWSVLANTPGFLGQLGGWNLARPNEACMLAVWENQSHYKRFMDERHDELVVESGQSGTYEGLDISFIPLMHGMADNEESLLLCMKNGKVLSVTDYVLKPGRTKQFENHQKIATAAMATASGALTRAVGNVGGDAAHYAVMTLWLNIGAHDSFNEKNVPALNESTLIAEDVTETVSRLIVLEKSWLVLPETVFL